MHDSSIIAIAADAPLANTSNIKQLDLNNIQQITDFILQTICQK
jgi:molybdopterin-guanine dinucleotide biosynthesis protein